jgi:F0F1-type ATP synthase assembly protein I
MEQVTQSVLVATMPEEQKPENTNASAGLGRALKYMHLAFVLPASVVAGVILGGFADRWFGTSWMYIAGACLGLVAGIVEMTRMLLQVRRENQ